MIPGAVETRQAGFRSTFRAEVYFQKLGFPYRLRSAAELPRKFIANIGFLEGYSLESCPLVPDDEAKRLVSLLEAKKRIAHLELVYEYKFKADHIFQMILNGVVYVDLVNQRCDCVDDLHIYRDEVICRAELLLNSSAAPCLPPSALALQVGNRFSFDGRRLEIVLCGATEIVVRDDSGQHSRLPYSLVRNLFESNSVIAEQGLNSLKPEYDLNEVIVNHKKLEQALARHAALLSPSTATVSSRTLRRWKKKVAGILSAQEQLIALAPENPGNRNPRISREVTDLAEEAVRSHHNRAANAPIAATFAVFKTLCDNAGVTPMSRSGFYEWIKPHEDVVARRGRRAAYQEAPIPLNFDNEQPVHGVRPHEVAYIDSTVTNIFAAGRVVKDLGKPVLTLTQDGATSQARAFYLSFDPPSGTVILMVLRDYIRRQGRLPKSIVLDNGSEFHSAALKRFCDLFGIHIRWRRRSRPRDSTLVERMLGAIEAEAISSMNGNTISLKNPRNVSTAVQPKNHIEWTLPALHGAFEHYLFQLCPNRVHPRFGISPLDYEKRLLLELGSQDHIFVKYDNLIKLLTSPHAGDPERKLDRRNGVFVDGMYYWNPKLAVARGVRTEIFRG